MAYVVGSASVEIVPDFRGAQLAITAWFAKQQNELKVPVRPELTPETTKVVERQAQEMGSRVGRAVAEGVARNGDMTSALSRQIAKLEADIEKAQVREKESTDALRVAQLRLDEARQAGNKSASQMLSLENAVEKAQNRVAEAQRNGARATEQLREARRKADLELQRSAEASAEAVAKAAAKEAAAREAAAAKAQAAQERLGAQMAKDVEREIALRQSAAEKADALRRREEEKAEAARQRELAAQQKADEKALAQTMRAIEEEARLREREHARIIREEEQFGERTGRALLEAINRTMAENEELRIKIKVDEEEAIREGRTAGGLLARSIHHEVRQNAGLITAAVTGALLLGGPLVSTAAIGLFAGIGAAGAFQSEKLQETWVDTFKDIATKGVHDASVLEPAFTRMAIGIGNSFDRMRPQVQAAFAELPDQIDIFTDSLTGATENALPGFVRAIENGRPVVSGFGDFIEDTGQGVTDLLDNITAHAPAAGQTLSHLGDTMGQLLPLVGELAGEGAELGTIVLPVLNSSLGGLNSIVQSLGGSLPVLAAGFLAFRTVQGTGRFVNQLSQGMLNAAPNIGVWTERMTGSAVAGERVMTATGRAAGGVAALGRALPAVGIGVAVLAAGMANAEQQTNDYAQALMKGGAAARQAQADMGTNTGIQNKIDSIGNFVPKVPILQAAMGSLSKTFDLFTGDTDEAKEAVDKLEAGMSGLELAQTRLSKWTEELAFRQGDSASSAEDVAIAQRKVAEYSQRAAAEQEQLERAIRGVTEAMAAQADAARARVDAEFGYQQTILDVQDAVAKVTEAQDSLNKARAEGSPADIAAAELELKQALLDTNTALRDQATAAGEVAMANLPAAMDDSQRAILGAKASLDELNAMMAMGIALPPELEQWRQQLIGITGQADGAMLAQAQLVASLGEVGVAVAAIPGTKSVKIEAPTEDLRTRLEDLGFWVRDIPGTKDVEVTAVTEEAKANLGDLSTLLTGVGSTVAQPVVDVQGVPDTVAEAQRATRELQILGGQRPNPVADLDNGPFNGNHQVVIDRIRDLAGQRPTPVVDANPGPFNNTARDVFAAGADLDRMRPNPFISATDGASGTIRAIQSALGGLKDKTVTITTKAISLFGAEGGAIEAGRIFNFDGGGAVVGRGSARDDLVPALGPDPNARYRIANGEHILDGLDVALLGGQAGVYAFRDMLKARAFGSAPSDTGIRQMVASAPSRPAAPSASPTPPRAVSLYTPDIPAAIRELKALEHQEAVMASPWP